MAKLRLWTLSHPASLAAVNKLHQILTEWDGQSDIHIVWDDTLTIQEFDLDKDDVNQVEPPKISIGHFDDANKETKVAGFI